MALDLTFQAVDEIWMEFENHCPPVTSIDQVETIYGVPPLLGEGVVRDIALCPDLELKIFNRRFSDLMTRYSENDHPVQFSVYLSGVADSGDLVLINAEQSYIGGSGIQRSFQTFTPRSQPVVGVNIHMQPQLFTQFFATPTGELPPELRSLVQGNDWQRVFSPKTTGAMRAVVQQIIDCPFAGVAKRAYLQGKVFELIALQLHGMLPMQEPEPGAMPKPKTVARIHQAAEILRSQLEYPPSQSTLAEQVGISQRTLNQGFRALFGMTPFDYLTQQRMAQAEGLLREAAETVAEVANRVGYASPSQFAAAFKRQFGISPSECRRGKKRQVG